MANGIGSVGSSPSPVKPQTQINASEILRTPAENAAKKLSALDVKSAAILLSSEDLPPSEAAKIISDRQISPKMIANALVDDKMDFHKTAAILCEEGLPAEKAGEIMSPPVFSKYSQSEVLCSKKMTAKRAAVILENIGKDIWAANALSEIEKTAPEKAGQILSNISESKRPRIEECIKEIKSANGPVTSKMPPEITDGLFRQNKDR